MIINADSRNIPLRDGVVQVAITSPPYWGLRDYGTGHWEGGVPFCNHGDAYKKGREDYKVNEYGSIQYGRLVKRAGFGTKVGCSCGADWVDPAIGLEASFDSYIHEIVAVFQEVRRVLRPDGLLFLNCGDKWDGNQLLGIPWRIAFALQADGWCLRSDIIWAKPNPMPESLSTKRCTSSHEYLFMFSKSGMDYYWDGKAIEEAVVPDRHSIGTGYKRTRGQVFQTVGGEEVSLNDQWNMKMIGGGNGVRGNQSWAQYTLGAGKGPEMRNKRDVWTITVQHSPERHYATFPEALVLPCILAASQPNDIVFDPFLGSGTTGAVATRLGRRWVGTELSWEYCEVARRGTSQGGLFVRPNEMDDESPNEQPETGVQDSQVRHQAYFDFCGGPQTHKEQAREDSPIPQPPLISKR